MTDQELFDLRINLIRSFLIENKLDAVLLSRVDNFAMATGGKRNYVNLATDLGASSILVRRDGSPVLVTNEIEAPRMLEEELADFDCETLILPWYEGSIREAVARIYPGEFASDDGHLGRNMHDDLMPLRTLLTEPEMDKYRELGQLASFAMESALSAIERGDTESEIAAHLVAAGTGCGFHVPVYLIAADDRIERHRHPLPTLGSGSKKVDRYVMVVGGFQRDGLNVSITRFKRFDELGDKLMDAYERICCVDANMQESTAAGQTLAEVLTACCRAYVDFGFAEDEWHRHHQGGATGYGARTCKATPSETFRVLDGFWPGKLKEYFGADVPFGQAYAWNPSAPGVKSEDTFLIDADGAREIVSVTPNLPALNLANSLGRETEVLKSGMAES